MSMPSEPGQLNPDDEDEDELVEFYNAFAGLMEDK
jgi:hypothetical protein